MINIKKNVIIIAGPTAGGKSFLASYLAKEINGVIVNADSMQIYKNLPILTSQPSEVEKKKIPHRLYSFFDASDISNAAIWREQAILSIKNIIQNNKIPILVGGTGMYLEFLYKGMSIIPNIPSVIRDKVQTDIKEKGLDFIYDLLIKADPRIKDSIDKNDTQRISRMWEIFVFTGIGFSQWIKKPNLNNKLNFIKILVMPERDIIRKSCNIRFNLMIENGLEREVAMNRVSVKDTRLSKAIGFQQICDFLDGKMELNKAIDKSIILTRQYAKRQSTWFKNRFKPEVKIKELSEMKSFLKQFKLFSNSIS